MILSPIPRCPAPYGLMAFSALLVFRSSRNFIRALCNCDLLLPIEQPTIPAISLCSYPSTSCSTKTIRYPGGRFSIALCNCNLSTEPSSVASCAPGSFFGDSSSVSIVSSKGTKARPFFRRRMRTTFTAIRCDQVENADSPRKVPIFRNKCRKASLDRSSASAVLAVIRRHSEYTRRLCRLYRISNASASPCLARSIASASESLSPCGFLASVKSPFPAALGQMRHKSLFVVLVAVTKDLFTRTEHIVHLRLG